MNFFGKKLSGIMNKITSKEFAKALLYALRKFTNNFYEGFGQRAQTILGDEFDYNQITLAREIYMINLWVISKTLGSEKKILDELHKIYLLPHSNENQIKQWLEQQDTEKLRDVLKNDENDLRERYTKYYADWNDRNGGKQHVLAMSMLEYMFNKGKSHRRFVRIDLTFEMINHILGMMKFIIDFRKKYEIAD